MKNSQQTEEGETNEIIIIAACIGAVFFIEFLCCIGLCVYFVKRKKKRKKLEQAILQLEANKQEDEPSFPHKTLSKGSRLKEDSEALAAAVDNLKMEYRVLEHFLERNAPANLSCSDAKEEGARSHNRYRDMIPYNHNRVRLSKPVGEPSTTYINASKIVFPGFKQEFLAVQAPQSNSIQNFWQLVIDKQVGLIVMITGLKEGIRNKATQYWPDEETTSLDLPNCTLKHLNHSHPATRILQRQNLSSSSTHTLRQQKSLNIHEHESASCPGNANLQHQSRSYPGTPILEDQSSSCPGTYHHRKFSLEFGDHKRTVNHLQTTAWMDFTAPSRSKLLLDLVYKTQELVEKNPGPILVHCSAGVGRTGTFIALYKLIEDYGDQNVKELDIADTVLQMRRQRIKMVQKKEQYVYIAKCLANYIADQEGLQ